MNCFDVKQVLPTSTQKDLWHSKENLCNDAGVKGLRDCSLFMPKGGPVFRVGG